MLIGIAINKKLKIYSQLIQLPTRVLYEKYKMKISKPQSLTTDTRLSQSHFFNNSLLNKTNLTSSSQKYHQIPNSFQGEDSKEADFLKVKNLQLQERVKRMTQQIKELEDNKINLLKMNEKYVAVLNQYYRDLHNTYPSSENTLIQSNHQNKSQSKIKETSAHHKKQDRQLFASKDKTSENQTSEKKLFGAEIVLSELQKDHRNLSKHVLTMENEIKNYAAEMEKFNHMKAELLAVNHTSPKELIAELEETTLQNRQLKKENNRLNFELQKCRAECQKLKKAKQTQTRNLSSNAEESEKLKAQINKVLQESSDKSNQYEQKIYELELKCEKLEKQLRDKQISIVKNEQKRKDIQILRVEDVHDNTFLRSSLTELLDPKKHPLLKLDRSFVYKKKKQKSISLSKTINAFK